MLKLYRGEDVIRQDPENIDPDQWLDKGELTERRSREPSVDQKDPEIPPEEIQVTPEDPEELYTKESKQRAIIKTRRWRPWQKKC